MKVIILIVMLAITSCTTLREVTVHKTQQSPSVFGSDKELFDKCEEKSKEVATSGKIADCGSLSKPSAHNLCCGQKNSLLSFCHGYGEAYVPTLGSQSSAAKSELHCGADVADMVADALTCGNAGVGFPKDGSADICNKVSLKTSDTLCCRGVSKLNDQGTCYALNNYFQVSMATNAFDTFFSLSLATQTISCGTKYDDLLKAVNTCGSTTGKTKEECGKASGTGFSCCYVNSKCLAINKKDAIGNAGCEVKTSASGLKLVIWLFALLLLVLA